jgi:hypothetical protein
VSRKLKKYNLKYEYLKLELEDTETAFWEYVSDFEHYFDKYYQRPKKGSPTAKENHVWVNEETGEVRHEPPNLTVEEMIEENKRAQREKESKKQERLVELKNRPDKIKKLYKKVAVATHPDKGGSEDEFKKVSDAFNNLDLATLLNLAGKYEVEYEVEDDDEGILNKNLKSIESQISDRKSTLAWQWGSGNKEERLNVLKTIRHQTGWEVAQEDLPEDLKPKKDEQILLEDKKSLDSSE